MTPSTLTLHRAALSSGDRAVWGRIIHVDPKGVATLGVGWPVCRSCACRPCQCHRAAQNVSLVKPMAERKPA